MTDKERVRKSKEWKQLRDTIYKTQHGLDFITGKPLRNGWQCHHLNPKEYGNLEPVLFVGLNKYTHKLIHLLFDYVKIRSIQSENKKLDTVIQKMAKYKDL